MKIIRTSGLNIPRTYENEEFYINIKKHLTRKFYEYNRHESHINTYYNEGPEVLLVPRFTPIQKFNSEIEIVDKIPEGKNIDINHNIEKLRDELQENVVQYMATHNNGLIQAPPGSGKTVMTIYSISNLKKKTFIIVHKEFLVRQWKERFIEFTDLKENDVSILRSSHLIEDLDKSIVISTDQTFTSLLRRCRRDFLIELNKANFGAFVADEVHTSVGAPTFAECSLHIPSRIVFGLSATPKRSDGTSDIMGYHLGNTFIPEGKASTMDAKVMMILFDFGIMKKSKGFICFGGEFQRSRYLKILKNSKLFLNVLDRIINKMYNDKRKIIVMCERLKLIEIINDLIKTDDKGIFAGNAKDEELYKSITFSTPGKIRDGVDIPEKDCLITTSPISNIDQLSGRILRIKEGKEQPIIIDFVDIGCTDIKTTSFGRLNFYNEKGFKIRYFYINELGRFNEIPDNDAISLISHKEK